MIIDMRKGNKNLQRVVKMGRWTWSYRLRIALVGVVMTAFWVLIAMPWFVSTPMILAVFGVAISPLRGRVGNRLLEVVANDNTRRQLQRAARDSGFGDLHVGRVAQTMPGELVTVRVPRGKTVAKLESAAEAMESCLRVRDVRVIADRSDRSQAQISIIRRDSFEGMASMDWPLLNAETVDVRKGIPLGIDEYGRVVDARLLSRNIILGGAPDAGKSAALRVFAAAAALDPKVKLWMMDAKTAGAEFVHWAPAAHQLIRGRDLDAAVEMFAELEQRVEARGQEIVARGEVFVQPDQELDVLMIDELPQFLRVFETDDKSAAAAVKAIRNHIWKLIAVGRWAGMITILSAQKPTADIVPSESRDLIDHKLALHCNTKAMSDTILGAGSGEEAPANAADIPSGQPGVGYYVGDNGVQKIRTFYIDHKQAMEVASRVGQRSLDDELRSLA
jgi:antitoxin (DNA-binding transcriptional repressor) of toxin-antitoxin stability system